MTVHSFARSKMPRQNMMNDVTLFSLVFGSEQHNAHRQETIDTTEPSPHGVNQCMKILQFCGESE